MYITKKVEVDVDIEIEDVLAEMNTADRAKLLAELGGGISPDSLMFHLQRLRQHAAGADLDRFLDGVEQLARALDFPFVDCARLRHPKQARAA